MRRSLGNPNGTGKTGHSRIRQRNSLIRKQISPVMAKVKEMLPQAKAAQHLAILIDEPLSTCQKLLCGERTENVAVLAKLLRSDMGVEVLSVVLDGTRAEWAARFRKHLAVKELTHKLAEQQRQVEQLQKEVFE